MHLPDGFLDAKTSVATGLLAAASVGAALRQAQTNLQPREVPAWGLGAAFVFAAQMLNFPVLAGTSGHLSGGFLCAALFGPAPAVLILTSVLVVQCLVFADGGVMALGANVLNMAVLGTLLPWVVFRLLRAGLPRDSRWAYLSAAFFAAWSGPLVSSALCAGQLAFSHTVQAGLVFPAMLGVHVLIGLGEALITVAVLRLLMAKRPSLDQEVSAKVLGSRFGWVAGVAASVALVVFVAPFASPWPDGLEHVAEKLGFAEKGAAPLPSPLPDYTVPGLGDGALSTIAAGLAGVIILLLLVALVLRVSRRRA